MYVTLDVTIAQDYFSNLGKEIDWDEDDASKIDPTQADAIDEILAIEASIYLLRRTSKLCGSLSDIMVSLRRKLITEYEDKYEPYVEYNDFY